MQRLRRRLMAAGITLCVALALPLALRAGGAGVRLPGTQPADGSGDPAFPPFNDAGGPGTLESPRLCSTCHANYRGTNERMYEYWDTWAGSMMANAARDPLLWAALDIANQDDAALGNVGVGDLCLRCHVPRAWYEGRSHCATAWGESFDGACLQGPPSARDNDFEGITCSVCHRAYDASAPPPGDVVDPLAPRVGNAQLYLSTDERRLLGPLTDADTNGYHAWLASRFHASSAFCGQCHEVTNPVRNRRDAVTGADLGYLMPIERTYSEYLQSRLSDPAAPEHETCQTCHMPQPDLDDDGTPDDAYACDFQPGLRGENTALDGPLRTHVFAGASAWMQSLLRDEYAASLNRLEQFDNAIDQTTRLMTQRAVTAGLTAPPTVMAGRALPVVVRVTNLAGHKFPTGYPEGRRAWVQVAAGVDADADGVLSASEAQFTSGAYDAASGVLTKDAQIKVYEAKLGVFDHNGTGTCDDVDARTGGPMFHFVLNDCVISDDRIPPLGFVPGPETAPVGYAYPDNPAMPGTLANYDDTPYSIVVPASATGSVVVEARVLYQSTSKEYVEFLRDESRSTCDPFDAGCDPTLPDTRSNRGEKMHDLWTRYGRAPPMQLAIARASVLVTPELPSACCTLGACEDLAPSACRAQEGDDLGEGTACATSGCAVSPPPPGEASNVLAGAAPLRVAKNRVAGRLDLTWSPACNATDHLVAWGAMADVRTLRASGVSCGWGSATTLAPGPGSWWMLAVGRTSAAEGSYGRASSGAERPSRAGAEPCDRPQDLSATCR